jgi:hypothetical protein
LIPLGMLAVMARSLAADGNRTGLVLQAAVGLFVALGVLMIWLPEMAVKAMAMFATAGVPVLAVTFLMAPVELMTQKPLPADPPFAKRFDTRPPVRVVWMLFDDLDDKLTFSDRKPGLLLPAIDDLTVRSFHGTRALAAQAGIAQLRDMGTFPSVSSLLIGRRIQLAWAEDASTEDIEFVPRPGLGSTAVLRPAITIFGEERTRGWNSAAAGWYLPYCRVLDAALVDCYWDQRYITKASASQAFPQSAVDEARMLFETTALSPFGPALVAQRHFEEYQALLAAGERFAADGSLGLALLHFNAPHLPYFYDPKIGRTQRYGTQGAFYAEGLQYVDRTIGQVLAAIRSAGLEDHTAVIVSSDHPFRASDSGDLHVPFIVHLPQDNVGAVRDREFSAVVTSRLILAIQTGEVKTSEDVSRFIATHSQVN